MQLVFWDTYLVKMDKELAEKMLMDYPGNLILITVDQFTIHTCYILVTRRKIRDVIIEDVKQGGRIFEISWEPNFPVNNFARNNGKIASSSTQ